MQRAGISSTRYRESYYSVILKSVVTHNYILYLAGAQGSSKYISSRNFPFFLRRPNCNGSEEHLIDCPESEIQNIVSCYYSSVVYCAGKYLAIRSHIIRVPVEETKKKTTLGRGTLVLG